MRLTHLAIAQLDLAFSASAALSRTINSDPFIASAVFF